MLGMNVIEVVIGLLFIYLLLSLLASIIGEIITGLLSLRGRFLRLTISKFIDDDKNSLSKDFLKHPFFRKISPPSNLRWLKKVKLPSYLSREDFSKIFLESILGQNTDDGFLVGEVSFNKVKNKINKLQEGQTKQLLLSLVNEAEQADDKLAKFRENLEKGYDSLMDRASGWYKRRTQFFLFIIGLLIAFAFNADTFTITNRLSKDPELRKQMVEMAETFQANADTVGLQQYYEMSVAKKMHPDFVSQLKELGEEDSAKVLALYSNSLQLQELMREDLSPVQSMLGLGSITTLQIPNDTRGFWPITAWIALKLLGWILTALAISLGAPFWFDMLNKVMKMRSSGKVSKA